MTREGAERPDWLPEGAIDCHLHVVDPDRFPYDDGPGYKPPPHETGTADMLAATLSAHGIARALLVQPSCYGADNSAMLAAMREQPGRYKAIAVVDPSIGPNELDDLAQAGIVGIRLNVVNMGAEAVRAATPLLQDLAERGWFVELQCRASQLSKLSGPILAAGPRLILDHLAYPDTGNSPAQPGFRHALKLAQTGRVFVKLSGAFRLSRQSYPHPDLDPFARAVLESYGPERCIWGSDWPFVSANVRPSYRSTLDILARWIPDEAARRIILADAPRALFGF